MARIITVTSGKGGVGKTNISVNIAIELARQGYRVGLFDADLGLANVNILLKLYPEYNLEDVIFNRKSVTDILIRDYEGIDIIPGGSGVEGIADLKTSQIKRLIREFSELSGYDYFFFDTSAGISRSVLSFCMASSEVIMVITPEPASLTDAYALLKVLSRKGFKNSVQIVANQAKSLRIAKIAYSKLRETMEKFLPMDIRPLGVVIHDAHVSEAVQAQAPFISQYPNSNASKCIRSMAKNLINQGKGRIDTNDLETFWKKSLEFFHSPLKLAGRRREKKGLEAFEINKSGKIRPGLEKPVTAKALPSDLENQKALTAPTGPPEQTGASNQGQDTHAAINRLENRISSLHQELVQIKKIIERKITILPETSGVTLGNENTERKPAALHFDFETFLTQRKRTDRQTH